MIRQFELVERVHSYDPDADEDVLNRAYVYGLKKHGTQLRPQAIPISPIRSRSRASWPR
jgi:GTP pyrophosphokinase